MVQEGIQAQERSLRQAAREFGLQLHVSYPVRQGKGGEKISFPHWQFRWAPGRVVLHYWPNRGSWRTDEPRRYSRGPLNPSAALELARKLASGELVPQEISHAKAQG